MHLAQEGIKRAEIAALIGIEADDFLFAVVFINDFKQPRLSVVGVGGEHARNGDGGGCSLIFLLMPHLPELPRRALRHRKRITPHTMPDKAAERDEYRPAAIGENITARDHLAVTFQILANSSDEK